MLAAEMKAVEVAQGVMVAQAGRCTRREPRRGADPHCSCHCKCTQSFQSTALLMECTGLPRTCAGERV